MKAINGLPRIAGRTTRKGKTMEEREGIGWEVRDYIHGRGSGADQR